MVLTALRSNVRSSVAGQVVILTGASEGIGRAMALELARARTDLILVARNRERLESAAAEVREAGGRAHVAVADVTSADECRAVVAAAIQHYGRLDGLINNAGMTMWANFADITDASIFEKLMRVNYLSCVYTTMAALPHLQATRGRILAVSSIAGTIGVPAHSGYCASKFAVQGFYESLRAEIRSSGVAITIVAPDFVVSEIHKRGFAADGQPLSAKLHTGAMTANQCARIIVNAFWQRRRQVSTSARGRLAPVARTVAPGLLDWVLSRVVDKEKLFRKV